MKFLSRLLLFGIAWSLLAGCSTVDDEILPPKELIDFKETLPIKKIWSTKLGKGSEFLRISLSPAGDSNRIYAASRDGVVSALNPDNGRMIWQADVDVLLSAGPGTGEDYVVVAGSDGPPTCQHIVHFEELIVPDTGSDFIHEPIVSDLDNLSGLQVASKKPDFLRISHEIGVRECHHASGAGGDDLRRIETEATYVAQSPRHPALVPGSQAFCGVFNHLQTVLLGQLQ